MADLTIKSAGITGFLDFAHHPVPKKQRFRNWNCFRNIAFFGIPDDRQSPKTQ
jgi:hypothetical protein